VNSPARAEYLLPDSAIAVGAQRVFVPASSSTIPLTISAANGEDYARKVGQRARQPFGQSM
jgi:hypothetical protein